MMLLYILFFMHIVGCVWFGITQFFETSWASAYPYGANGTIKDAEPPAQYLASIYWAFTTISTIGYGDIVATNDAEKLLSVRCFYPLPNDRTARPSPPPHPLSPPPHPSSLPPPTRTPRTPHPAPPSSARLSPAAVQLCVMAIGSAIFGAILSKMTDLVSGIDVTASRKRLRMDVLNAWMAESSTPPWLFRRLRQYYFHYYDAGVDFGVQQQVLSPPPALPREPSRCFYPSTPRARRRSSTSYRRRCAPSCSCTLTRTW